MKVQTIRHFGIFIVPLVLGALVISAPVYAQRLDHFKCYGLLRPALPPPSDPPSDPPTWKLADQFSEERVVVGDESRFCNPVEKRVDGVVTPILDKNHHLTFYDFEPVVSQPISGEVKVINQFGEQKFEFKSANLLAVPTWKQEPGLLEPKGLDHFKCYFIAGPFLSPKAVVGVGLVDQFEKFKHKLLEPFLLCNPTSKVDEATGVVTEIVNPDAHLTCYTMTPGNAVQKSIVIANQFTHPTKDLFPFRSDVLCVPSRKEGFKLY